METFAILTLNGLAMGMLIFLIASGLSLIFGLMGVLNLAHGALFMCGAYAGVWIYGLSHSFSLALVAGTAAGIALGVVVEKLTVSRVYGDHLAQILITVGVMLVLNELVKVAWGPNIIAVTPPPVLDGSWQVGSVIIVKYRLFTILVGLSVVTGVHLLLNRTKIGMIVRAGVENSEMVQALGINIRLVFTLVFMVGAGMAAFGGAMTAPFIGRVDPGMGMDYLMLALIVVVIGGLGSFLGSALGSVIVGLAGAYVAWLWPEASMAVNVLLMALILLIKPSGLLGTGR